MTREAQHVAHQPPGFGAPQGRNKGKHYRRAACRVCGRDMPVMPDGKIGRHGSGSREFAACNGSYKLPKGENPY